MNMLTRHEPWSAQRCCSQPDLRGFLRHPHRRQYRIRGAAKRDNAVVLQQDNTRGARVSLEEQLRSLENFPCQRQPGIYVGHKHRLDIAAHNLVGKNPLRRKLMRPC